MSSTKYNTNTWKVWKIDEKISKDSIRSLANISLTDIRAKAATAKKPILKQIDDEHKISEFKEWLWRNCGSYVWELSCLL